MNSIFLPYVKYDTKFFFILNHLLVSRTVLTYATQFCSLLTTPYDIVTHSTSHYFLPCCLPHISRHTICIKSKIFQSPASHTISCPIHPPPHVRTCVVSAAQSKARLKNARYGGFEDSVLQEKAPLCPGHQEMSKLVKVNKSGPNKGRKFYSCKMDRDQQCKFFMWAEVWILGQVVILYIIFYRSTVYYVSSYSALFSSVFFCFTSARFDSILFYSV